MENTNKPHLIERAMLFVYHNRTPFTIAGFIVTVILCFLILFRSNDNQKEIETLKRKNAELHREIIAKDMRQFNYTDSLNKVTQVTIAENKEETKRINKKVESNFATTMKLLKKRHEQERNSVIGTPVDSTVSNWKRLYEN